MAADGPLDKSKPNQEVYPKKKKKNIKHARRKPSQVQAATAVSDVNFMRPTGLPSLPTRENKPPSLAKPFCAIFHVSFSNFSISPR